MIQTKVIITCDRCGSTDVETKEEWYNHEYRKVRDCDNLSERFTLRSVDKKLVCHCNNCGNDFEEKLGSQNYSLAPYEVEI